MRVLLLRLYERLAVLIEELPQAVALIPDELGSLGRVEDWLG